jgi:hypothetical protein
MHRERGFGYHSHRKNKQHDATSGEMEMIEVNMIKKIVAVILILLTSGSWFYLDKLNSGEQMAAEQLHRELDQSRTQVKLRAEAKAKFESQILLDLTTCLAAAEKANKEYTGLLPQALPRPLTLSNKKVVQFTVPQAVIDEGAKVLATAKTECQATYDIRLKNG